MLCNVVHSNVQYILYMCTDEQLLIVPKVQDWGLVIVGRVLMSLLNINVLISLFKLLTLLISAPVDLDCVPLGEQTESAIFEDNYREPRTGGNSAQVSKLD